MADNINNTSGGGNTGMAFVIGAVIVVLAIVAYFVFAGGGMAPKPKQVDVNVKLPEVSAPSVPAPSTN